MALREHNSGAASGT